MCNLYSLTKDNDMTQAFKAIVAISALSQMRP